MQQIVDYDDLFERFSIMTVEGKLSDEDALKILEGVAGPQLLSRLIVFLRR